MKRLISMLLSLILAISFLPMIAPSAYALSYNGFEYEVVSTGMVRITGYSGTAADVSIPSELNGFEVVEIAQDAFKHNRSVVNVSIPMSVTTIGDYAFCDCSALQTVIIWASAADISKGAFQNCTQLTDVSILGNVTTIKAYAFYGCSKLQRVSIPESVTSINDYAFYGCNGLETVDYYGSITQWKTIAIGSGNDRLAVVTIFYPTQMSLTASGACGVNVFWVLDSNGKLTISGTGAMADYTSFDATPWHSYQAGINHAFVASGVTHIGANAFGTCYWLYEATIPLSVTGIGNNAFYDCSSLDHVYYSGTQNDWNKLIAESGSPSALQDADILFSTPVLQGTSISYGVVQVKWQAVAGASKYLVFRKTNGSEWAQLGSVTSTSYLDKNVANGNTYTYTVRAYVGGKWCGFDYSGTSIEYVAPELQSASFVNGGTVQVKWKAVDGAQQYRVFRRTNGSEWATIGNTIDPYFNDTNISNGNTYTYTVRSITDGVMSGWDDTGITPTVTAPVLQSASVGNGGAVQVKWKTAGGAAKYRVFRKTNGSEWATIGYTTNTYFNDANVSNGNTYTYTVRSVAGNGMMSGFDAAGVSIAYVAPVLQGVSIGNGSAVQVTWKAVSGATKYVVFRKTNGSEWAALGNAYSTGYLDKNVVGGNTYTYTVRAVVGGVMSGWNDTGLSIKYIAPVMQSVGVGNGSAVQVTWKAVSGATKYVVFRKTNGSEWAVLGNASTTSYLDKNVVSGNTYTYTVRAVVGGVMSGWNDTGLSINYIEPVLQSAVKQSDGIKTTWGSVSGATKYIIFRKTNSSEWVILANAYTTNYLDKNVAGGNTYTYTVRAVVGGVMSGWNDTGLSVTW